MRNKRSLLVLSLVSLLGLSIAKADDDSHCFTLESFKGTYAIVAHYEGDIAIALGVRHFDDEGNLTGTFVLNEPEKGSTTGARTILTGTQKGSISTLKCNGTGVITRTATASNGMVTTTHDDFVVTRAIEKHGKLRVTAIQDAQVTPSSLVSPPVLLTRVWTRVPHPNEEEEWEQ